MTTPETPEERLEAARVGVEGYMSHWDACPFHPDRVRNFGRCECGFVASIKELEAAAIAPVEAERDALREALRIAGIRIGILVARMRGRDNLDERGIYGDTPREDGRTGRSHELSIDEGESWLVDMRALLPPEEQADD